ncbi:MAG TPA: beta-1-3, beta-1-6-glucan biosynthesis protein [Xanthobacteraceae bacterium]
MSYRVLKLAGGICAAVWLFAAATATGISPAISPAISRALAQNNDAKPADQQSAAPKEGAKDSGKDNAKDSAKDSAKDGTKEPQKIDEFAEAQRALSGPAGNPECVWLGRRVVSLLWRDDLDTAFRHLDLYDRFGCPSGHIQVTFRCLVLHANTIDPKAADSLNGRVHACWINPALQPPAPAAAAQNPTATR